MLIAAVTFVLALTVVLGTYWVLIVRPEQATQRELRKRMRPQRTVKAARISIVQDAARLSSVTTLNAILSKRAAVVAPLADLIEQSALRITVGTFLLASGCLFLLAYLVVFWLTRQVAAGLLTGGVAGAIPFLVVSRAKQKRLQRFEELFPEAIELVTRALRAGHAFTTGLAMVADEAPQPVSGEFRLLYDRQNFGMALPEAMRALAQRVPLLDVRLFVIAVLTQRETGGNLSEVLDNLTSVIRARFQLKREVRIKSAHGRMTGWILALLPPALAVAFLVVNPNHMKVLVSDPLGVQMIIGAAVLQIIGTLVIRRIVNIEY